MRKNKGFAEFVKKLGYQESQDYRVSLRKVKLGDKSSSLIISKDQIDDDFVLAQTKEQRMMLTKAKSLSTDQLHNLSQCARNAERTIKLRAEDKDGE